MHYVCLLCDHNVGNHDIIFVFFQTSANIETQREKIPSLPQSKSLFFFSFNFEYALAFLTTGDHHQINRTVHQHTHRKMGIFHNFIPAIIVTWFFFNFSSMNDLPNRKKKQKKTTLDDMPAVQCTNAPIIRFSGFSMAKNVCVVITKRHSGPSINKINNKSQRKAKGK